MTCYHPLKGWTIGINEKTGKKKIKITNFDVQYLKKSRLYKDLIPVYKSACSNADDCTEKYCTYECLNLQASLSGSEIYTDWFPVPCGKCIGCQIDNSREWAVRMMLEKEYSTSTQFLTLTYSDEWLTDKERDVYNPFTKRMFKQYPNVVYKYGEKHLTVNRKDFPSFIKRLRKHYGSGIRFYGCSEYGEKHFRPHYHAIIFNLDIPDRKEYFKRNGIQYYTSDTIAKLWPFGIHVIGDVNFETCSYVSRYVTKKVKGADKDIYDKLGIERESAFMSRNKGIGYQWFLDHNEEAYRTYIINLFGGKQVSPPHYYDYLYEKFEFDLERLEDIKNSKRISSQDSIRSRLSKTDLGYQTYLGVMEYNFKHKPKNIEKLSRERIDHVEKTQA